MYSSRIFSLVASEIRLMDALLAMTHRLPSLFDCAEDTAVAPISNY